MSQSTFWLLNVLPSCCRTTLPAAVCDSHLSLLKNVDPRPVMRAKQGFSQHRLSLSSHQVFLHTLVCVNTHTESSHFTVPKNSCYGDFQNLTSCQICKVWSAYRAYRHTAKTPPLEISQKCVAYWQIYYINANINLPVGQDKWSYQELLF